MKKRRPSAARLTLICAIAALVLAPAATADISVGVADDHPKESPEIAGRFYDTMKDVGLTENRITILWDASHPTFIRDRDAIAHAIEDAAVDNVRATLALYPEKARAITERGSAPGDFAAWTALVARAFPGVKDIIIGNEPNKARFWQPQREREPPFEARTPRDLVPLALDLALEPRALASMSAFALVVLANEIGALLIALLDANVEIVRERVSRREVTDDLLVVAVHPLVAIRQHGHARREG